MPLGLELLVYEALSYKCSAWCRRNKGSGVLGIKVLVTSYLLVAIRQPLAQHLAHSVVVLASSLQAHFDEGAERDFYARCHNVDP